MCNYSLPFAKGEMLSNSLLFAASSHAAVVDFCLISWLLPKVYGVQTKAEHRAARMPKQSKAEAE